MSSESKSTAEESAAVLFNSIVGGRNERGIPAANFVPSVDAFLAETGATVEAVLKILQELHSKYKFMEVHMVKNKGSLKVKIPEIEKSLKAVQHMMRLKEAGKAEDDVQYSLADNVFARASADLTGTVCLWLGANVMLEYTYEEAEALLQKNLANAKGKMVEVTEDLSFLRNQIITTEITIARFVNHDVAQRRKVRTGEASS